MKTRRLNVQVAVAGAALILACWALGGGREAEPPSRSAPAKAPGARPRIEPLQPEAERREPAPKEVASANAPSLPPPLEDEEGRTATEEEREAERRLWNTIRGLLERRDEIGWHECRRRIVEATGASLGFQGEGKAAFRNVTDMVAAEIGRAEAAREAASQGLPDSLGEEERERLAGEIEEQYQAQMERARGWLEELLGKDEQGRRFIIGRLEEWLVAVEWMPR